MKISKIWNFDFFLIFQNFGISKILIFYFFWFYNFWFFNVFIYLYKIVQRWSMPLEFNVIPSGYFRNVIRMWLFRPKGLFPYHITNPRTFRTSSLVAWHCVRWWVQITDSDVHGCVNWWQNLSVNSKPSCLASLHYLGTGL